LGKWGTLFSDTPTWINYDDSVIHVPIFVHKPLHDAENGHQPLHFAAKIPLGARTQGLVVVLKVQRSCQQTSGGRGHPKQRRSPKMEEFPYVSIIYGSIIYGIYGHMIYGSMESMAI